MGIGKRLREARERKKLTQKELADLVGITSSAITNYEKETSHPKETVLYDLMNVLEVEPNYLFQDCVKQQIEFTDSEVEHIKKYRQLDQRGQRAVDETLEREYQEVVKSLPKSDKAKTDGAVHWEMAARNGHGASGTMTAEEAEEFFKLCDETEQSDDL